MYVRFRIPILFLRNHMVARDAEDGFTVDLQGAGLVKFDDHVMTLKDFDTVGVLHVLALEDARENHQGFELAGAIEV